MKKWTLMLLILTLFPSLFMTEASAQDQTTTPVQFEEGDSLSIVDEDVEFKQLDNYLNVPNNKTWTFTFNNNINPLSIAPNSLYVLDSKGNNVNSLIINDNQQTVTVLPPPNRYLEGETYSIYFTSMLESSNGIPLSTNYQFNFSVASLENTKLDQENENMSVNSMEIATIDAYKNESNKLEEDFDIVQINKKHHQRNLHMWLHYDEQQFLYTPNSFYVRIKELMIRIYTPPVYY
ncbi:Ig-like domain-containing protein [Alkalihalobacillus sp. BA299]|uniref:Ig-like domain-containing protein n=1 Tax=Alkalihalobacillus sp. BA299 TaxID=2815938 RepID=UPI001ADBCAA7|nr:Ig-like domain-containing protein [Alkalihalobacillus sp. BA299]